MDGLKASQPADRAAREEPSAPHPPGLATYLARFGHRLRLRAGWLLAQRCLWIACLGAVLIQVYGRVWPVERLWAWTLAPLMLWLVSVAGITLLLPLPLKQVARRLDAELGLKERLATALELETAKRGALAHLVALQRHDALDVARSLHPSHAFPLRWLRRPLLVAAALAVAAVALAVLPNPMNAVLRERAAVAQAAEQEASRIEQVRQEIEQARDLTPEVRQELLRQLDDLAQRLRANPGDREQALADLSRVEEALRRQTDARAESQQAALETLAAQLQALAAGESSQQADLSETARSLEELAQQLADLDVAQRQALARSLAQLAAQAAQAGEGDLAQSLAQLAQAVQSGQQDAATRAARAAGDALAQAESRLANQAAVRQALAQLQQSRQALAQAGQGQAMSQGRSSGQGQGQTQGRGPGQGQGQGQPGGGGGTQADTLPPFTGLGKANRPQGAGQPGTSGALDQQVYVPWERRQGNGQELFIPGQDTGQGEIQLREQKDALPGTAGEALVPYHQVYYDYLDAANQTMERSDIPPGLKDYVRAYFSQLEP